MTRRSCASLLVLLALCSWTYAEEWSRFRGPNGSGVSAEATIPTRWTLEDFRWRVKLPGVGHSSPVVWGDRIFVGSADRETGERYLLCRSTKDGSEVWTKKFAAEPHHVHNENSLSSCTPAVDKDRVYVLVTSKKVYQLVALDHDGKELWRADLGKFVARHGAGTSPVVHGGLVFVNNLQQGSKLKPGEKAGVSSVLAVDAETGDIRWQVDRKSTAVAYSTPCVAMSPDGREQLLLTSQSHGMTSYDLLTGRINWEMPVFNLRTVSSPLVAGKLAIGTSGSGGGGNRLVAIDVSGTKPTKKYEINRSAPYVPTPVAKDDLLFLSYDRGVASCVD
ncbi:MAG: PQQ-like beta-propeller repeat protein, partial [Pirellulales bacterium]|nr:PQQ-like beta-propeller repeat protein [Pirellulales bacterium]